MTCDLDSEVFRVKVLSETRRGGLSLEVHVRGEAAAAKAASRLEAMMGQVTGGDMPDPMEGMIVRANDHSAEVPNLDAETLAKLEAEDREADAQYREIQRLRLEKLRREVARGERADVALEVIGATLQTMIARGEIAPVALPVVQGLMAMTGADWPGPEHLDDLREEVIATGANALAMVVSEEAGNEALIAYGVQLAANALDEVQRTNVTHLRHGAVCLLQGIGSADDGSTLAALKTLTKSIQSARRLTARGLKSNDGEPEAGGEAAQ